MSAEAAADRLLIDAAELLEYLDGAGVQISLAPNGVDLELRGTTVGTETCLRISALKPQLRVLLAAI
jgi:hypothetical protein